MSLCVQSLQSRLGTFVLNPGDFSVERGELLMLLGPSGCGKTTLLRTIAGFLSPEKGSIRLNGKDVTQEPVHKREIGFVFQDYALFPHMTVFENIAYGLKIRKPHKISLVDTVGHLLEIFQLVDCEKRRVSELSGGEQQRVALARALAPQPKLMLLDEPLSALDQQLRKNLRKEIKKILATFNIPTVYVTHDQEEAMSIADSVLLLRNGTAVQPATSPERLYASPEGVFAAGFFGVSNLLPGVVESIATDGYMSVRTCQGILFCKNHEDTVVGDEVCVFFRPEQCSIGPARGEHTDSPLNMLSGVVSHIEFSGDRYSIEVELSGTTVTVYSPSKQGLGHGAPIMVTIAASSCKALAIDR